MYYFLPEPNNKVETISQGKNRPNLGRGECQQLSDRPKSAYFLHGTGNVVHHHMDYQPLSLQQMKEALAAVAGSKYPVTIIDQDGLTTVRYVRGFADSQNNVVLVSENSYSLALKIIETKNISALEYAPEHAAGLHRVFKAKWLSKRLID